MISRDRTIKLAFEKQTGTFLYADEVFSNTRDAFAVREEYSRKRLMCYECEEPLFIATSKLDRLFSDTAPMLETAYLKTRNFQILN